MVVVVGDNKPLFSLFSSPQSVQSPSRAGARTRPGGAERASMVMSAKSTPLKPTAHCCRKFVYPPAPATSATLRLAEPRAARSGACAGGGHAGKGALARCAGGFGRAAPDVKDPEYRD